MYRLAFLRKFQVFIPFQLVMLLLDGFVCLVQVLAHVEPRVGRPILRTTPCHRPEVRSPSNRVDVLIMPGVGS